MARIRPIHIVSVVIALVALSFLIIRPAAAHQVEAADQTHEAHEGYGVFTVEGRAPVGGGAVYYVVRLTWSGDGHPATGASVTGTAISPAGIPYGTISFVPLDADGRYGGTLGMPSAGWWTVQLASATPSGSLVFYDQTTLAA